MDEIERRKVRHLFYLQVDNPLVDICGPEFVGYHLLAGSEFSTQVIAKRDPLERVGNVVQVDGRLMVIEYSDLPDEAARRRNPDGSLKIWAGSIAVHVIDAVLLRRVAGAADALPFHIAQKKSAHIDAAQWGRHSWQEGRHSCLPPEGQEKGRTRTSAPLASSRHCQCAQV